MARFIKSGSTRLLQIFRQGQWLSWTMLHTTTLRWLIFTGYNVVQRFSHLLKHRPNKCEHQFLSCVKLCQCMFYLIEHRFLQKSYSARNQYFIIVPHLYTRLHNYSHLRESDHLTNVNFTLLLDWWCPQFKEQESGNDRVAGQQKCWHFRQSPRPPLPDQEVARDGSPF